LRAGSLRPPRARGHAGAPKSRTFDARRWPSSGTASNLQDARTRPLHPLRGQFSGCALAESAGPQSTGPHGAVGVSAGEGIEIRGRLPPRRLGAALLLGRGRGFCGRGRRGRHRGFQSAWVHPEKRCGAEQPAMPLWERQTPCGGRIIRGAGWRREGYSLGVVASRSAARSGGTGIDRMDLGFGRRWWGDLGNDEAVFAALIHRPGSPGFCPPPQWGIGSKQQ